MITIDYILVERSLNGLTLSVL